jgi:hypothetical protein
MEGNRSGTKRQWKQPKFCISSREQPESSHEPAVEAAVARQEEITPELLRVLEETVERAAQLDA